ncbi:MAG: maltose alpha-D-glucosyltransferase [Bacteroidales bacterium]|nr:maltose alpha-D-glucosyltransferase [Bacteroidales bacterium]
MSGKQNPLWYKDAIIYQLHVRAFFDSNDDGIGDFKGLIRKLDYIKGLGVNTIWLLPFYPSPLKDGGYDIADFKDIHPDYGTLADFRRFVKEAHSRGLRIITELVLNHTSTEHKWFQRARRAKPGSVYRDYYVWSDTPDKYADARIIFQDFEVSNWTYDHVAGAYYWHRFYSHQPDLNFENPRVQEEIYKVLDFWFDTGVDGFRLDAVPYLYEAEGTNCENLPETHAYLKKLRRYVDEHYQDKLLLAEANQWPSDACAYFGDGDECHMAFHFPLMPRLYMALRMEDRFPVVDILEQTPDIPDNCQWAIFLRNHDELTLEMVSDEEREYMYRAFALDPRKRINVGIRRRLFPLLGGDTRSIELLNVLLLSMPGTPIIYYGDEIGMGDNYYLGDRDGVRTPMQWSPNKNAGFSNADPQRLFLPVIIDYYYHYTTVNVENQEKNPSSFLWWQRRVIAKRAQYKAFGRGTIKFINTSNPKILAFVREYEEETILVVVNLSRYSQYVELELSEYAGSVPIEVFSRNRFSPVSEEPWPFAMQFKNYFWFELKKTGKEELINAGPAGDAVEISDKSWQKMDASLQQVIRERLHKHLLHIQWFRGDVRKLRSLNIIDVIRLNNKKLSPFLFLIQLDIIDATNDIYLMPLSIALNARAAEIRAAHPDTVITPVIIAGEEGVVYDGAADKAVTEALFDLLRRRARMKGLHGFIEGKSGHKLRKMMEEHRPVIPKMISSRQTNSSIIFGDSFFMKIYRTPQEGENPDVELVKQIKRKTTFHNVPRYMGRLDYHNPQLETTSLAMLMEFIPNVGTAWEMTQTSIESFFDKVLSEKAEIMKTGHFDEVDLDDLIGPFFLDMVELLARRTAEMHLALASIKDLPAFAPEKFSVLYQKSLYQAFRTYIMKSFRTIRSNAQNIPEDYKDALEDMMRQADDFLNDVRRVLESGKLSSVKCRLHGNYKLDKVLFTGNDFVITDFEGQLESSFSVRKIKHSPLRDVASMITSFHFAIHKGYTKRKEYVPVNANYLRPLVNQWYRNVSEVFVKVYAETLAGSQLIPDDMHQVNDLVNMYMLEKAVQELNYFVRHDPASMVIPLSMLERLHANL